MRTGRVRHCLALFAGAVTLASGAAAVVSPTPAYAGTPSAPIDLSEEPFSYSQPFVPSRWSVPALPSGTNAACLTAGSSTTQTPVPGCGGTTDPGGQGALRLTGASGATEGGVSSAFALPTSSGLDFTFDTYQYGGTGSPGDGLLFYLAATDPSNPSAASSLGGAGGDLGYTSGNSAATGVTNAYLGVGLDVYGDFSSSSSDGTGCTDPSWAAQAANAVTIRGPGEGTQGYCLMSSTAAGGGLRGSLSSSATIRAGAVVPVEVAINPTASATTTASGLTVPAYSYLVSVTPIGSGTQTISGSLPDDTYLPSGDSYWTSSSTGIPYQVVFGFAASTGTYDQVHEVSNLAVAPLSTTAPAVLSVAMTDNDA
ncbi:MAG TPA: hypothetical protein VFN61_09055, partial [Acidimicrobiales bacterium]|nr:hypothetical protein [Acidimicrobiales bacterium]